MNPANGSLQQMRAQQQQGQSSREPNNMLTSSPAAPASPERPSTSPELAVSALSETTGKADATLPPLREGIVLPPFMPAAEPLGPTAPLPSPDTLTAGPLPASQSATPPSVQPGVTLERAAVRHASAQQPLMVALPSGTAKKSIAKAPIGTGEFVCKYEDCRRTFRRKTSLTNHTKAHLNKNSRSILRMKRMQRQAQARQRSALDITHPAVGATRGYVAGGSSSRAPMSVSPMSVTTSMSLATSVAPQNALAVQHLQQQQQQQAHSYLLPHELPPHPSHLPPQAYDMPVSSYMGLSGTSSLATSQYGHGLGRLGTPDDESGIVSHFAHGLGRDDVHAALYPPTMAPPQWPPEPAPSISAAGGLMSSGFNYDAEPGVGAGPTDPLPFAALQDDQPGHLASERLDTQYLNSFESLQHPVLDTMKHIVLPEHPSASPAPAETPATPAEATPAPSPARTD